MHGHHRCTMSAMLTLPLIVYVSGLSLSVPGLPPSPDVTALQPSDPACTTDLAALRKGLDSGQLWAQTMWDAGAKSVTGLLSQTAVQFGDFDECLTVGTLTPSPLAGQYCLVNVSPREANTTWAPYKVGLCVPASCNHTDLQTALQGYMDQEAGTADQVDVAIPPVACTTADTTSRPLTIIDIIYCVVVLSIVITVCAATVHEVMLRPDYDGVSPPKTVTQCLSARHGFYSLMRVDQQMVEINLTSLYGIHTFAFFFVILGHRFGGHLYFMSLTNYRSVEHMFAGSWFSIWAGHLDLFVDIFFFMSAFLLSVLYYATLQKRFISPALVYLQRLCRIIPAYAVVVFFYATLLRQLGDGPLWNLFMDEEQSKCRGYWWANLLFINTYVETDNMCLLQSWYLSCEFQLFVVGTLLVFTFHERRLAGLVLLIVLFIASTLAPFLGTYLYDRPAILLFDKEFWADARHHDMFTTIYTQGHYRGTSYIMGLIAGWYVYQHRKEPLNKKQTYILQVVGLLISMILFWTGSLFYDKTQPQSRLTSALYAAFHHTIFGFGQALVFISCTLGQPSPISVIFSWKGFVPLSKLSYCVYLVHNIPQFIWAASSRTLVYLNPLELVSWTIADVAISLVVALVLCLTVETPARYLIKYYISGTSIIPPQTSEPQERYKDVYNVEK